MPYRSTVKLIFICLFFFMLSACGEEQNAMHQLPQVTYIEAEVRPVTLTAELSGRTSPYEIAEIRPQVSGIIQKRLFEEGSMVQAGDVLYQIDPALYQANVDQAKAALMQAEASAVSARLLAERYKKLLPSEAVSRQEYDNAIAAAKQAEANVAAAKAQLNTATINLAYTKLSSPISGIIGKSSVTAGALVSAQQPNPLATVQVLDPMYVDVTQSSAEYLRLKQLISKDGMEESPLQGASTTLTLPDGSIYPEKGELLFSESSLDPSTGSYLIRAKFPNPKKNLLPNLFIRLKVDTVTSNNAILIPQRTVGHTPAGEPYVVVLNEKKPDASGKTSPTMAPGTAIYTVENRPISIAQSVGNKWVVLSGLKEKDKILLDGGIKLSFGLSDVIGSLATSNSTEAPTNNMQ